MLPCIQEPCSQCLASWKVTLHPYHSPSEQSQVQPDGELLRQNIGWEGVLHNSEDTQFQVENTILSGKAHEEQRIYGDPDSFHISTAIRISSLERFPPTSTSMYQYWHYLHQNCPQMVSPATYLSMMLLQQPNQQSC